MKPLHLTSLLSCIAVLGLLVLAPGVQAQEEASRAPAGAMAIASETAAQRDARMKWWREDRFGLFIHWGLYAVPAGEWGGKFIPVTGEWIMSGAQIPVSQYAKLAPQFNPVKFNAQEWVDLAKDAGMKYIVITSKHHDGFGMFRSAQTDWCIKSTPFKRDPLIELASACKKQGMRLCFYHSILDWHHPDYLPRKSWNDLANPQPDFDRYVAYMKAQLKELLTGYGPVGVLWFDGEWEDTWTYERGKDLYTYVRSLQPEIIINNRVGKGRAGMSGMDADAGRAGDFGTPEQQIPATGFGPGVDWESCMTMNDTWGFRKDDQNWKSAQTLVRNLINCASKGGNYLLNVGPTAEGLIPQPSIERLKAIGQWMKANNESIYNTTASPFTRTPWGRCTKRVTPEGATLYLHVFSWPATGELLIPGLLNRVEKAYCLTQPDRALTAENTTNGLTLALPAAAPDPLSSTIAVQIKGTLHIKEPPPVGIAPDNQGVFLLPAADAELNGDQIRYEPGSNRDCLGWWFNPGDWAKWEIQAAKAGDYDITAETASIEPATLEVRIGDQKIQGQAPATGDFGMFKPVKLGTIHIDAGKIGVALHAVRNQWHAINVRSVRIAPSR